MNAEIPKKYETVVGNFEDWKKAFSDLGMNIIEKECTVYSAKHKYAGSVDAVAEMNGKVIVLDWKTSNNIHPDHAFQVSAYAKAYEEMTGKDVKEAWVVRFEKHERKKAQVKEVADVDEAFKTFLAARSLFRGLYENDIWKMNVNSNKKRD